MALVDINWQPTNKQLRIFAALWVLFGAVVATILAVRFDQQTTAAVVLAVAAAMGSAGVLVPRLIRPVYVVWMALAFPIGWTISHAMMVAVYFLILTPIGVMLRWCGHDAMRRRIDRQATSYWINRSPREDVASYFRQY